VRTVEGDLLELAEDGEFDVIAHGCNCFCNMGKGIALSIRRRYPAAFAADRATDKGARSKLGTCTYAVVSGRTQPFIIVNAYTQFHWTGVMPLADYDAIRRCFRWLRETHGGKRIGLPRIGAGLAGGDWATISELLLAELGDQDVTVVEYRHGAPRAGPAAEAR
jgi:O-acetyl-ADP-ribose deacetylase (regulator of RNase III)